MCFQNGLRRAMQGAGDDTACAVQMGGGETRGEGRGPAQLLLVVPCGLGLEQDGGDFGRAIGAIRRVPPRDVSDPQAQKAASHRRKHGDEAGRGFRILGKADGQRLASAGVHIDEFCARIHRHDVAWHGARTHHFRACKQVGQMGWKKGAPGQQFAQAGEVKVGERALAVDRCMHWTHSIDAGAVPDRGTAAAAAQELVPGGGWLR